MKAVIKLLIKWFLPGYSLRRNPRKKEETNAKTT
jgi:hypothetical protein